MRHADVTRLQNPQIAIAHPDAMRGHRAPRENAKRIELLGGSIVTRRHLIVVLLLRLGKMDQQRHAVLVCQRSRRLQGLIGIGIQGVRRNRRNDQRIAAEALNKLLGILEARRLESSRRPQGTR